MSFIDWYESLEPHANSTKFYNKELLLRAWVAGSKSTCKWNDINDEELNAMSMAYESWESYGRAVANALKRRNT